MKYINLGHGPASTDYHADLLIVGAGIAGLVIADRLRGAGYKIDILESGGLAYEQESQALNDAEMDGLHHSGTTDGRFRVFGGSSTRWGAQLLTMEAIDFQAKSYLHHNGWPLSYSELNSYLRECEDLLGVDHLSYDSDFQNQRLMQLLPLKDKSLQYRFSKRAAFRYRNMARTLGQRCRQAPNIRIFLHATVTNIVLHPSRSIVKYLEVHTAKGSCHRFHGKEVVIAAGGIETTRLLLASRGVHSRGIGNQSDQLGRWFHDHLVVNAAVLHPINRYQFLKKFAPWHISKTCHYVKFATTSHWQMHNSCLNMSGHLSFQYANNSLFDWLSRQLISYKTLQSTIKFADFPYSSRLPAELFDLFHHAWMRFYRKRLWCPSYADIVLRIEGEQNPTPDNRITLSNSLDRLGMPKAVIKWQLSDDERRAFASYKTLFATQWEAWNIGDVTWLVDFESISDLERWATDSYHIMGGTRMSNRPSEGVVDPRLNVFGVANLSVASLSVFPTGGVANPTLTLMMLALRLADRLNVSLR